MEVEHVFNPITGDFDMVGLASEIKNQIPLFCGVLPEAVVINEMTTDKSGKVYYIDNPVIEGVIQNCGIFAYKLGEYYYRSWNNVKEYMNDDFSEPLGAKLFECNNKQYVYSNKRLNLITNTNKVIWKRF